MIKGTAKILLIDDEAEKGWGKFYECFFKFSPEIKFQFLDIDFKLQSRDKIIDEARKMIEGFDPDLILLDLRLCDADFNTNPKSLPKDLTGYQILKDIKDINKGLQVVITTASNKIWNYESTESAGANGYIVKEDDSDISENIRNLRLIIEKGIYKSSVLKNIAKDFFKINEYVQQSNILSNEYKKSVENNLEITFKLLEESYNIPKYINYSYLQLFLIVEEFLKEEEIFIVGDMSYVVHEANKYLVLKFKNGRDVNDGLIAAIKFNYGHYALEKSIYEKKYIDTNFKMSAVLLIKYGFRTSGERNWTTIYKVRNEKAAHPEIGLVENDEYKKLVDFLLFILNGLNFKPVDIEKGLTEPTDEERTKNLKEKWGSK